MKSYRVLPGILVERTADGVAIPNELPYGLTLSVDDLRALVRFAETGEEPPEPPRKDDGFAKFLDGLLNKLS